MGQESHPEVQEGSGGPPGVPGKVRRPTKRSSSGREADPKVRETQQEVRVASKC